MIRRKTKQNPTDHDLISKLAVKKSFPDYGTMYEVYLGKRRIGFADIDHGKTEISFVNINEEYRRKGVSSFLYDYIEKDLGRKLKPSTDLLDDGEAFWKARSRRNNPRDEEFLKKIRIEKRLEKDLKVKSTYYIIYDIYLNTEKYRIGFVVVRKNDDYVLNVDVDEQYRRKGLASFVYDYIEKDLNIKLRPSFNQLDDGAAFWKFRSKKNPKLKPKPKNARPLKTSKTKTPR